MFAKLHAGYHHYHDNDHFFINQVLSLRLFGV